MVQSQFSLAIGKLNYGTGKKGQKKSDDCCQPSLIEKIQNLAGL